MGVEGRGWWEKAGQRDGQLGDGWSESLQGGPGARVDSEESSGIQRQTDDAREASRYNDSLPLVAAHYMKSWQVFASLYPHHLLPRPFIPQPLNHALIGLIARSLTA